MAENKAAPHSFVKDGVYYFIRRVPNDLRHHYTSSKISYSLRTRSVSVAASRAVRAAQKLDEYWYHLRINDSDLPGKHMLRMAGNVGVAPSTLPMPPSAAIAASVKLSEAVSIYLRLKGKGRPTTFQRSAERSCGYVIDVSGDKDITAYTKADANAFRDDLLKRGLTGSSITRIFGTVRSVINFAASEIGIDFSNPFGKVYYAIFDLRQAVRIAPEVAEYWIALADAEAKTGNGAAALAYLNRAEASAPMDVRIPIARAKIYGTLMNDPEKAGDELRRALALSPDDPKVSAAIAWNEWSARHLEAALAAWRRAIDLDPANAEYHVGLATVALLFMDMDQAEAEARRSIELQPVNANAYAILNVSLRERGDPQGALAAIDMAISISPENPSHILKRAMTLDALGRETEASEAREAALAIEPEIARGYLEQARLWRDAGYSDTALSFLATATFAAPVDPYFQIDLSRVFMDIGDSENALTALEQAVALAPADPEVFASVSEVWQDFGDTSKAMDAIDRAISLAPAETRYLETRAKMRLGGGDVAGAVDDFWSYVEAGETLEARAYSALEVAEFLRTDGYEDAAREFHLFARTALTELIKDEPQFAWHYHALGVVNETLGNIDEAIDNYTNAYLLDTSDTSSLEARASLFLNEKGDIDAAIADYRLLVSLNPGDTSRIIDLANAYLDTGDLEAALQEAERVIAMAPDLDRGWRLRGDVHKAMRDAEAAIDDYSKAIALDGEYRQAIKLRGDVYSELLGDYEKALVDYSRAIEIRPDYVSAYRGRVFALNGLGRFEEALADLERVADLEPDWPELLFQRGRVERNMLDLEAAVRDLRRYSENGNLYGLVVLYLAEWPSGEAEARAHLRDAVQSGTERWPMPIARYFLGDLSADALSAAATNDGERCEADYYVAADLLLRGEVDAARPLLVRATEICPRDFIEYNEARASLLTLPR